MVYCTVAFTWVTAAVINLTVSFPTSAVVNGYCWSWWFWPSDAVKMTYSVLYFIFYFFNLVVSTSASDCLERPVSEMT